MPVFTTYVFQWKVDYNNLRRTSMTDTGYTITIKSHSPRGGSISKNCCNAACLPRTTLSSPMPWTSLAMPQLRDLTSGFIHRAGLEITRCTGERCIDGSIRAFHPWQNGLDRLRRPSSGTISHGDNCRAGALRQWECRSPGVCQGQNGRKQEAKQSFVTCNIIPSGMHHHYPMLSKQRTSKDHVNLQIRNPRFSIPVF